MFPSPEQESSERREKLLRELGHIEIYTRRVANRALVGDYRSSLRGEGVDFIEHKKYVAGDNWRRIDWNVFARTGQPYVRICYEEKEMLALIVADLSPSMDLGSEEFSKKDVLVEAVATIAFSAAAANMSVGLVGGGGIGGFISSTPQGATSGLAYSGRSASVPQSLAKNQLGTAAQVCPGQPETSLHLFCFVRFYRHRIPLGAAPVILYRRSPRSRARTHRGSAGAGTA